MKTSKWTAQLLVVLVVGAALWTHASCSSSSDAGDDWYNAGGGKHTGGSAGSGSGTIGQGGNGHGGSGSGSSACPGKQNACGTCEPECKQGGAGSTPFPVDSKTDPNVKDATGVTLDKNGDLTIDGSKVGFNYMWISNTYDTGGKAAGCDQAVNKIADPGVCRGTISKIDTVAMKEVARYFTVTCATKKGATGCEDVNGQPITLKHNHTPSRTAVDYNFDAWVANRNVHGGQPSATKLANSPADCVDKNGNGVIDTSKDQNDDGTINVDCDGDGQPDSLKTVCKGKLAGKPPEFLGDDDECILFTTNYSEVNSIGRSLCLDVDRFKVGASNAWVGTYNRPASANANNQFYEIDGKTGKILSVVEMPAGHRTYGCAVDDKHIVWATEIGSGSLGSLAYFSATLPHKVGPLMRGPDKDNYWKDDEGQYHHYGITIDGNQYVWLGGYTSAWVLRYKPNRTNFDSLSQGTWTRIDLPKGFITRGIAADTRGKVWVSIQNGGYIARLDQNLPDGQHDLTGMKDYWKLTAQTVIGSGVDMAGNLWGVGHGNKTASRLDVDEQGNVISPPTGEKNNVTIGENPYTYSDFTGYALMKFLLASGRYVYQHSPCPNGGKASYNSVTWNATTPEKTEVVVRVRTGDSDATFGQWSAEFPTSPAVFGPGSAVPISPNPAKFLQVEFTLRTQDKTLSPTLHDYVVGYTCPAVAN